MEIRVEMMGQLEAAAAANLRDFVEAYRRAAPETGATGFPFAGGYMAFTGRGSPLTTIKGLGPSLRGAELDEAARFFWQHGAEEMVVEAAPWLDDESRATLEARGFTVAGGENVVVRTRPETVTAPPQRIREAKRHAWAELMLAAFELPLDPQYKSLVHAAWCLRDAVNLGVMDSDDMWMACAQMVPCDGVWIFGCDGTLREARGRGAQTALILERLRRLPPGALAVAEVAPGSGSERNYLRCGFEIAYRRTHYLGPCGAA